MQLASRRCMQTRNLSVIDFAAGLPEMKRSKRGRAGAWRMSGGRQGGQADRLRYLLHDAEAAMWHVVHGMSAWHGLTLLTTSQDVCGGQAGLEAGRAHPRCLCLCAYGGRCSARARLPAFLLSACRVRYFRCIFVFVRRCTDCTSTSTAVPAGYQHKAVLV